ncbi:MAG: hypothetical protein JW915_24220 [Chitinispirillaceae bacterium]|nr:hypothetical protein [Chitinispirillaceae bacterium]
MVQPDEWDKNDPNWWSVIADGKREGFFYWRLKSQIVKSLQKSDEFKENGLKFEPDEIVSIPDGNEESARISVLVNIYERDAGNRKACIEYHGCKCAICGFDFEHLRRSVRKAANENRIDQCLQGF